MSSKLFRSFVALLLIAVGVALLLGNLGVFDAEIRAVWNLFFPTVFLLYGLKLMVDSAVRMKKRGRFNLRWFWGGTLALLGALLLLGRFEMINFHLGMAWRLWPLVVVHIGLATMFGNDDWHAWEDEWSGNCAGCGEGTWKKQISVGKVSRSQANWSAEAMDVQHGIGDLDLDFTRAFIPEENIPVRLNGWIGDVNILVPKDVEFAVTAKSLLGDLHVAGQTREGVSPALTFKTPGYDEATRKLTFDIFYRILDLRIDQV